MAAWDETTAKPAPSDLPGHRSVKNKTYSPGSAEEFVWRQRRSALKHHGLALVRETQKSVGFCLDVDRIYEKKNVNKPGFCYLKSFTKRTRKHAQQILGRDAPAKLVLDLWRGFSTLLVSPPCVNVDFTFDPLHCEFSKPRSWSSEQFVTILSTFPNHILGAPRARFQGAMDLLASSIHKDAILSEYSTPTLNAITESQAQCPNHVPEPNFTLLQEKGLPVDANATGSHPHPAMKALEESILRSLAHMVHDECTVAFMKPQKFRRLASGNANFVALDNPTLSVRDVCRWGAPYKRMRRHITTPSLFLHDCGHYVSPSEVSSLFDSNPALQKVYMSAILPDELVVHEPSWHPSLYRLEKLDSNNYGFILAEDGEFYEQPYSSLIWLKINAIKRQSGRSHAVDVVSRNFAHKLIVITREASTISNGWYITDSPDDVVLPEIDGRSFSHSSKRVPRHVFNSVLTHSISLSTQRFQSTMAKVRTYQGSEKYRHINADTWTALAHVCYALSSDPATLEREQGFNSFAGLILRQLRRFLHRNEWLQPALTALGVTVSWGSLLLPLVGVHIPDWHFSNGITIPGWSYGALGSLVSQVILVASSGRLPGPLGLALRSASIALPHVAYLLPNWHINGELTIPSYIGGIVASVAITTTMALLDNHGSHYEVKDLIKRLPQREQRRWALVSVRVTNTRQDYLWHPDGCDDPDGPPPAYDPQPPASQNVEPSVNPHPCFIMTLHGAGSSQNPDWVFDGYSFPPTPPESDSGDNLLLDFHPSPPVPNRDPMSVFDEDNETAWQEPDASVQGLAGDHVNPHSDGEVLRLRFGLLQEDVLETDESCFTKCPLPDGSDAFPLPFNMCLLDSLTKATGLHRDEVWRVFVQSLPREELDGQEVREKGLSILALVAFCYHYSVQFRILGDLPPGNPNLVGVRKPTRNRLQHAIYNIYVSPGHWSSDPPQFFRGANQPPNRALREKLHRRLNKFETHLLGAKDWTGRHVIPEWFTYTTQPARAKPYARDLKNRCTGTIARQEGDGFPTNFTASMDSMVDSARPRKVILHAILGAPGSSKSSGLVPHLKDTVYLRGSHWKMAVPRAHLRNSWKESLSLGNQAWRVGTFETNLQKSAKCLIVEEVSQMPPGYVDYALIQNPSISCVLLVGDVTQGNFHEPHPDSTLNSMGSEAQYFANFCSSYRFFSNSIPRAVSNALGLPTRSKTRGYVKMSQRPMEAYPIVCASESEQKMYANAGYTSYTFGTVQGQRFEHTPVQIVLSDAAASMVSRGDFASAMCRSNIGVIFIPSGTQKAVRGLQSDPFLSSIFCGTNRLAYEDLFQEELRGLTLDRAPDAWDPLSSSEKTQAPLPPRKFNDHVLFRGGNAATPNSSPNDPGLCHLVLVPEDSRTETSGILGYYPSCQKVHGFLESSPQLAVPPVVYARCGFRFLHGVKVECAHLSLNPHDGFPISPRSWFRAASAQHPNVLVGATLDLPIDRASIPLQALLNPNAESLPEHVRHDKSLQPGPPTASFQENEEFIIQSFGDLIPREERELYEYDLRTNLFEDAPWYERFNPTRLEQFFPRHKNDDTLTFMKTVDKRLRFAPYATNVARYRSRNFTGPILFDGWCRTTGIDPELIPPFDEVLYSQCIFENDFTKLTQKTQATLLNNADRADPDWRDTFVRIFMKSQLKVKLETLLSPFKAGQTLASFQDHVILITGPMTRYLTIVDEKLCAPHYYYHPGHSPLELSSWCASHWKDVPMNSTNDYTAFDQSQTGEAVSLELTNLRAHHIPDDVIEYYIDLKLNLCCQFGELAVMRFTGEGPTLKFNSDFNAALIGVQYDLPSGMARAVAGDDMALNGTPQLRASWHRFSQYLTIVAKPETVKTASFCSWLLTPHGVIKEPRVVFAKLMIARDRQEEDKVLANLLNEVAVGYRLGDHVYEHLDSSNLGVHFWLIRYFVTRAPLRFKLLLTTRSISQVLRNVWHQLDKRTAADLVSLQDSLGELWMLESRPTRIAASILTRVGGFALRGSKIFDQLMTTSYRY